MVNWKKMVEELVEPEPIHGHYGMIEGWWCPICRRSIGLWFFGCKEGCSGFKARKLLSKS